MNADALTRVARAICKERCAVYGEMPCWKVGHPVEACTEDESCEALARAAIEAMEKNDE